MKATDLRQALQFFDPQQPLESEVELREWFVQRPQSPRSRLRMLLESRTEAGDPQKILLVGHRGSGKTTELTKLSFEVAASYHTISFDILEILGRTNLAYEDLMLAVSTQVMQACIERDLVREPLSAPVRKLWGELYDWWTTLVAGRDFERAPEASISIKLKTLLGQIELGVKHSSEARDAINARLRDRMPELVRHLNRVVDQAETDRTKRLLVVIEGLDKIDLPSATSLFRDHAPTITSPRVTMIFTFPLALRQSDDFNTVRLSFPVVEFLPNFRAYDSLGEPDLDGRKALETLVTSRMDESLLTPEAMDLLLGMNGGIPAWLVILVRNAVLYTLDRSAEQITLADVAQAVRDLRRDTLAPLTRDDREVLRKRHVDRLLTNDKTERRLLYNGSLIEYPNEEPWCDAHPVLWNLLERESSHDSGGG
jgi:hypothetical protein